MSRRDGRGPNGEGPMTGQKMGKCSGSSANCSRVGNGRRGRLTRGYCTSRGVGRRAIGRGRIYANYDVNEDDLRAEQAFLQSQLATIEEQLSNFGKDE